MANVANLSAALRRGFRFPRAELKFEFPWCCLNCRVFNTVESERVRVNYGVALRAR